MSEEIKNVNVEEIKENVEETKEKFGTKVRGFMKKNGKKIAVAAAVIGGLGLIYAIGKSENVVSIDIAEDITDAVKDEAADVVTNQ